MPDTIDLKLDLLTGVSSVPDRVNVLVLNGPARIGLHSADERLTTTVISHAAGDEGPRARPAKL